MGEADYGEGLEGREPGRDQGRDYSRASGASSGYSADPVRQYLKDIGRFPLLNGEGEVRLASAIAAGVIAENRLAEAAAQGLTLTLEDRRKVERAKHAGDDAKRDLTNANLRLVVSIAKRYANRGMTLLDLIQEGNLGLMRAVERFDHTKGFKFSTYATWWIRQAITRSIADQARTIRIPVHMVEIIQKVSRAQRDLLQELGREPAAEEIGLRLDMTADRVREIQRISYDPLSLESPVGEEDGSVLGDFIHDAMAVKPEDAATRSMLNEAVELVLEGLSDRERDVVRRRFGLEDGQARTLEQVGKEFAVTRERIRQIETKTLAKLRHPQRSQKLKEYLEE